MLPAWLILKAKQGNPPYWDYEDLGAFLLVLALLTLGLRVLVRLRLLANSELVHPDNRLQLAVVLFLIGSLYAVLKLRYRRQVLRPLGWVLPENNQILTALVVGALLGLGVVLYQRVEAPMVSFTPSPALLVLSSVLGPILEESIFRGCLLPLIARARGNVAAIVLTACLFALFHGPTDLAHWISFTFTGVVYGLIRVASGTTTASALTHAIYNLTLYSAAISLPP